MKGKSNRTVTPKLRFPEFRDDWRCATIGELFNADLKPVKAIRFENDKILSVRLHVNGVVRNERTSALTGGSNYFKRRAGQFIFSKIDLLNGAFGIVPQELDGFYSSSDVPAFSFGARHSPTFFLNWLSARYRRLNIERTGTSATLKRVSPEKFWEIPIWLPSPREQQKIADCLGSLDSLIAAEGRKLAALRDHKRGLMQQLFPQPGQTQPRLRFPEFRGKGEWVERRLGDISQILMCKRVFTHETSPSGEVPFYKIGTLGGVPDAFIPKNLFEEYRSKYNFPRIGEVFITCSGTIGKCLRYDGNDAYFQDSNIVWIDNPSLEVSNEFLLSVLSNVNWNTLNSTTITRIYGPDLRGLPIKLSQNKKEQQRIANCLSSLDTQITAQTAKIETLKQHKSGLMQRLFPASEAHE